MENQNPYEVKEEDYQELEDLFGKALNESLTLSIGDPALQDSLETFITNVGISVKDLLQKYHTDYKIKELEVKDAQEQLLNMKRKVVKMELQFRQIENAINGFNKIKRG